MLVLFEEIVINLNNIQFFWVKDLPDNKNVIAFLPAGLTHEMKNETWISFDSVEKRDETFRDILTAYAKDQKVIAIIK